MAIRKIELMHRQFGISAGNRCKDCENFVHGKYHTRMLSKCSVYGLTHSEASDWSGRHEACGMFNREWTGNEIIRLVRPEKPEPEILEGQECIFND